MDNSDSRRKRDETNQKTLYNGEAIGYSAPLWYIRSRHAISYVLGIIEVLLAFRFLFRLLGANPGSGFVSFLYNITGIFTAPFKGIFNSYTTQGLSAASVFEPGTIIGMAVYAIIAWGLVNLLKIKISRDVH
ncbi:MAG: YggT family protein [Bacillota bacterium]|nr:YggT family protein [Bacillota bacterium]